jgi:hypothetical protein
MTPTVKKVTETLQAAGLIKFSFTAVLLARSKGVSMGFGSKVKQITVDSGTPCILTIASEDEETNLEAIQVMTKLGVPIRWQGKYFFEIKVQPFQMKR